MEVKEDIGQEIIDKLDELNLALDKTYVKTLNKVEEKKNSHLHMNLETSLMNKLREEANKNKISISELVRQKLRENNQLNRIESKIDKLNYTSKNNNH